MIEKLVNKDIEESSCGPTEGIIPAFGYRY
jgi:hypothetical protein